MRLWSAKPGKLIYPSIQLSQVIANHIKPGICLLPLHETAPTEDAPAKVTLPEYKLAPLKIQKLPVNYKAAKRAAFEFHFTPNAGSAYFELRVQKAFALLDIGRRVELHLHKSLTRQERKTKRKNLKEHSPSRDEEPIRQLVLENLHFHPDVMAKAFPEESKIIIRPQTDFEQICWVVGPGLMPDPKDVTKLVDAKDMTSRVEKKRKEQLRQDERGMGQLTKVEKIVEKKRKMEEGGEEWVEWKAKEEIEKKMRKGEVKAKKLERKEIRLEKKAEKEAVKKAEQRAKQILKGDEKIAAVDIRRVSRRAY